MYCASCGFANETNARFCRQCGKSLASSGAPSAAAPAPARPPAPPRAPRAPMPKWVYGALLVVLVLAGALYWWIHRPPGDYQPVYSGLFPTSVDGKWGYFDRNGKTVIQPQFDGAGQFSEGLAAVRVGTQWGYIDSKGTIVVTPQFATANNFQRGRAVVQLCCAVNGQRARFGFVDKTGKLIGPVDLTWAASFTTLDITPVQTSANTLAFEGLDGTINGVAQVTGLGGFGHGGLAQAAKDGKWGYVDRTGKWVIEPQFELSNVFSEGVAAVRAGGRWGVVDMRGRFVVNPQFDFVFPYHDGIAQYNSGGKSGFINKSGARLFDSTLSALGGFKDGLAPVRTADGVGYIDTSGKLVIPAQFDWGGEFSDGFASVLAVHKPAYITKSGAFVVNPFGGMTLADAKAKAKKDSIDAAAAADSMARVSRADFIGRVIGEWVGGFDNDNNVHLTIAHDEGAFTAWMSHSGNIERFQEVNTGVPGQLGLRGVAVTKAGAAVPAASYSLDNFVVVPAGDSPVLFITNNDAGGHHDQFTLRRVNAPPGN